MLWVVSAGVVADPESTHDAELSAVEFCEIPGPETVQTPFTPGTLFAFQVIVLVCPGCTRAGVAVIVIDAGPVQLLPFTVTVAGVALHDAPLELFVHESP